MHRSAGYGKTRAHGFGCGAVGRQWLAHQAEPEAPGCGPQRVEPTHGPVAARPRGLTYHLEPEPGIGVVIVRLYWPRNGRGMHPTTVHA